MHTGVMDIERILSGRRFRRLAQHVEVLESTTSTNDYAWRRADNGAGDGYVVFAEYQTAGRGRMGRSWVSPRGASVICTTLLIDSPDQERGLASMPLTHGDKGGSSPTAETLGLIAGIATAHAITEVTGITALIAWPNDILLARGKVAGILVESRVLADGRRAFALGIGINCLQHRNHFPPDLRSRATSLDLESSVAIDRESVAAALLSSLDDWLADPSRWDAGLVREAFLKCATPLGRSIRLRYKGSVYSGQVLDLDPSSGLVLQLDHGVRKLFPAAGTSVLSTV